MTKPLHHSRTTLEGRKLGAQFAQVADEECRTLAEKHDEPDERCLSCAFRAGTVPNGCPQTQLDVAKAVFENVPFMCHAHQDAGGSHATICHGWFALRRVVDRRVATMGLQLPPTPYEFSPPD
ncbi:MAG: hypothetical protein JWR74_1180 [Polaromonas sp.]|nr:hypothetical protein [Polaromonas sp.]